MVPPLPFAISAKDGTVRPRVVMDPESIQVTLEFAS